MASLKKLAKKAAKKPSKKQSAKSSFPRLQTGIQGLDVLLRGGFLQGGTYLFLGAPGSGKTILANQICFNQSKNGRRSIFVTLLAENHTRMFGHLDSLAFFDRSEVSEGVHYVSGYNVLEKDGVDGLMRLLSGLVQKHKSAVLCIDGVSSVCDLSDSAVDFKKFVHNLNTVLGMSGCTTILLSSIKGDPARPEYTMVDGIVNMKTEPSGMYVAREIEVTKFRGSSHLHGAHFFEINDDGICVYPRADGVIGRDGEQSNKVSTVISSGIPGLDDLLSGGFRYATTCALLGPSGTGKTTMGIQFLVEGARRGENGLLLSLYEHPNRLLPNMKNMNIDLPKYLKSGRLDIVRLLPTDYLIDKVIYQLLDRVRAAKTKRLFLDGVVGLKQGSLLGSTRLGEILKALNAELKILGVTTLVTEETDFDVMPERPPLSYDSAITDDIIELRHVQLASRRTPILNLTKTRSAQLNAHYFELILSSDGAKVGNQIRFVDPYLPAADYIDEPSRRKPAR